MSPAAQQYPLGQPTSDDAEAVLAKSFPAVAESLGPVRDTVVAFAAQADVSEDTVEAIRLVCSEAAANVVEHAYPASAGDIHLRAVRNSQALWIVIADDGRGLVVRLGKPSTGFGFAWMARFSDAMTLEPAPSGGLELSFRFRLRDHQPGPSHP